MTRRFLFPILALFLFAAPAHADLAAGLDAVKRGDWPTALKELKPLADKGNPVAMRELAAMYSAGNGVPKDEAIGRQMLKAAADKGDAEAQVLYVEGLFARVLFEQMMASQIQSFVGASSTETSAAKKTGGFPDTPELRQATDYIENAARLGDARALHLRAVQLLEGLGVRYDAVAAFSYAKQASDKGLLDAKFLLARMYMNGEGVAQSDRTAKSLYEEALASMTESDAARRNAQLEFAVVNARIAMKISATTHEKVIKDFQSQNYAAALPILRKLAESGDPISQHHMGEAFEHGLGLGANLLQAVDWYQRSVAQGYGAAALPLARMYVAGQGVRENLREARRLFRIALKFTPSIVEHSQIAQLHEISYYYENGKLSRAAELAMGSKGPKDPKQVREELRTLADRGSRVAAYLYVMADRTMREADRELNDQGRERYLTQAANAGMEKAFTALGRYFLEYRDGQTNFQQAIRWFREGVNADEAESALELGRLYEDGLGIARDHAEAFKLYQKADALSFEFFGVTSKGQTEINRMMRGTPSSAYDRGRAR